MKKDAHPTYYPKARVICACGNTFTIGSTLPELKVELCNKCHPFYTGKVKFVDTLGRVERFQKKQKAAASIQATLQAKKVQKQERRKQEANAPKTLREMLLGK